ncbi:MAG TPA: type IV secretion system protein [Thermoanaerobaculia bacterium]|nr:type IV secretion system protein [Thermoanaerobaculia bacterium]
MRLRIALLTVGLGLLAAASHAQSSGILTDIVTGYERASRTWIEQSAEFTRNLFASLVLLELSVTLVAGLLAFIGGSGGVGKLSRALLQKIAYIGLFWAFITSFSLWIPRIIWSFDQAGVLLSGTLGLQPSVVLDRGVFLCTLLLYTTAQLGALHGFAAFPSSLLVYLSALGILVCFALIAARLVEALVKSYLVMAGAAWFLGFSAFRLTAPLAENYLITVVRVGVQIFVQYLLVAVGQAITGDWIVAFQGYTPDQGFRLPLTVLGGAIVYAWLVIKVPSELAHSLTAPSGFLRLREALTADV